MTLAYGLLAYRSSGEKLQITVLKSAAGYYLGTLSGEGYPFSREPEQYWPSKELAEIALETGEWTQRYYL